MDVDKDANKAIYGREEGAKDIRVYRTRAEHLAQLHAFVITRLL